MRELSADEVDGLQGLSIAMIQKVVGHTPRIVEARLVSRNGKTVFGDFRSPFWYDRLRVLFDWDDISGTKKRSWDQAPYRQLLRSLNQVGASELGEPYSRLFRETVWCAAARHLWVVPQFDADHLTILYKASKHHAQDTRQAIAECTVLERVNWISCCLHEDLQSYLRAIDPSPETRPHVLGYSPNQCRRALRQFSRIHCRQILQQTSGTILENPAGVGLDLRLHRAVAFDELYLERLDDSSPSDSGTEAGSAADNSEASSG